MKTDTPVNSFETFAKLCRYNSGTHFLDSGGDSGRHWQRPAINADAKPVTLDIWTGSSGRIDVSATIETAHLLAQALKVDREMETRFAEWADQFPNDSWFELSERFATEELGLTQRARDNAYNGENDLSQVFIYEVYTDGEDKDWLYADNALTCIFIHTGADVRGGYSRPVWCRARGDYPIPVDLCAEFYAESGTDEDGNELERDQLDSICEKWRSGYSSRPASELERDVAEVVQFEKGNDWAVFKLKSGETVKVDASIPYCG